MHIEINLKRIYDDGMKAILIMDIRKFRDPIEQYQNGVEEDGLLATVSGRNINFKPAMLPTVKILLFDKAVKPGKRGDFLVCELHPEKKTLFVTTSSGGNVTKKFFEGAWKSNPYRFIFTLSVIEELYANQPGIDYKPFLRQKYLDLNAEKPVKSNLYIGPFFDEFPEFFKEQANQTT